MCCSKNGKKEYEMWRFAFTPCEWTQPWQIQWFWNHISSFISIIFLCIRSGPVNQRKLTSEIIFVVIFLSYYDFIFSFAFFDEGGNAWCRSWVSELQWIQGTILTLHWVALELALSQRQVKDMGLHGNGWRFK